MKILVLIEDAGSNWAASSSDAVLGGCIAATAPTRDAVIEKFRSALRFHLNDLRTDGKSIPQITDLEIRELIAA